MILSKDSPKQKKRTAQKGEASISKEFFEGLGQIKSQILKSSVFLKKGEFTGSGVIFYADDTAAYILTAKHLLYLAAGQKSRPADTTPADLCDQFSSVTLSYDPSDWGERPANSAPVASVNLDGCDDQNWEYDVMVLTVDDATFLTYAQENQLVTSSNKNDYSQQLKAGSGNAASIPALKVAQYDFIQVGYGGGDKDIRVATATTPGTLQTRNTSPMSDVMQATIYEYKPSGDWPQFEKACILTASNVTSTGEGDSGGPLFAISKDRKKLYLVGVTAGANMFTTNVAARINPSPADSRIDNNVIAFWGDVFIYWRDHYIN